MARFAEPRNCLVCGREFRPQMSNVRRGGGRTCSHRCDRKTRDFSNAPRGPLANNYKHGGYVNYREAPHVRFAHNAVKVALRRGDLVKGPCEQCGTTSKVEAHHDDYNKPLEVRWLCFSHHREWHRVQRAA